MGIEYFLLVAGLVFFLPALAVAVRQLHDANRSGWWYLIILVLLVGSVAIIAFFGANRGRWATTNSVRNR
jgi:uncharacterized membrane protein YhaH (DUF805 family)